MESSPADALPLWLVTDGQLATWLAEAPPAAAAWARANGFQAEKNESAHAARRRMATAAGAVIGLGSLASLNDLKLWHAAGLSDRLSAGHYRLADGAACRRQPLSSCSAGWIGGVSLQSLSRAVGDRPRDARASGRRGHQLMRRQRLPQARWRAISSTHLPTIWGPRRARTGAPTSSPNDSAPR